MSDFMSVVLQASLAIMMVLLLPCAYRAMIGPTPADRLQAIDAITTLLVGIIVLLMLVKGSSFVLDIALALAAFSFIGTLGIARYLADGKVF